jgi:hypothetical protein
VPSRRNGANRQKVVLPSPTQQRTTPSSRAFHPLYNALTTHPPAGQPGPAHGFGCGGDYSGPDPGRTRPENHELATEQQGQGPLAEHDLSDANVGPQLAWAGNATESSRAEAGELERATGVSCISCIYPPNAPNPCTHHLATPSRSNQHTHALHVKHTHTHTPPRVLVCRSLRGAKEPRWSHFCSSRHTQHQRTRAAHAVATA